MPSLLRRSLAEALGTFGLVFIGVGSVAAKYYPDANYGLFGIATAHALVLSVMITATMAISGGHINPAVTFAAVITGRMKVGPGVLYVAAQLLGAVVGALLLDWVVTDQVAGNLGAHAINEAALQSTGAGVAVEAILTFVLVFTVFAVAVDPRGPSHLAPIAIGLAVLIDHFVGVPLTGASMNPARSFGPALVANEWADQWVYWIGPLLGGGLAGLVYYFVYLTRPDEEEVIEEPVTV